MSELLALLVVAFFVYNCFHRVKQICRREKIREIRHKRRMARRAKLSK